MSVSQSALVTVEFSYNGEPMHNINISNPTHMDVNSVSAESRASNTRFEYSGRHDHGDLPQLKTLDLLHYNSERIARGETRV
jgi:hypothetical protein